MVRKQTPAKYAATGSTLRRCGLRARPQEQHPPVYGLYEAYHPVGKQSVKALRRQRHAADTGPEPSFRSVVCCTFSSDDARDLCYLSDSELLRTRNLVRVPVKDGWCRTCEEQKDVDPELPGKWHCNSFGCTPPPGAVHCCYSRRHRSDVALMPPRGKDLPPGERSGAPPACGAPRHPGPRKPAWKYDVLDYSQTWVFDQQKPKGRRNCKGPVKQWLADELCCVEPASSTKRGARPRRPPHHARQHGPAPPGFTTWQSYLAEAAYPDEAGAWEAAPVLPKAARERAVEAPRTASDGERGTESGTLLSTCLAYLERPLQVSFEARADLASGVYEGSRGRSGWPGHDGAAQYLLELHAARPPPARRRPARAPPGPPDPARGRQRERYLFPLLSQLRAGMRRAGAPTAGSAPALGPPSAASRAAADALTERQRGAGAGMGVWAAVAARVRAEGALQEGGRRCWGAEPAAVRPAAVQELQEGGRRCWGAEPAAVRLAAVQELLTLAAARLTRYGAVALLQAHRWDIAAALDHTRLSDPALAAPQHPLGTPWGLAALPDETQPALPYRRPAAGPMPCEARRGGAPEDVAAQLASDVADGAESSVGGGEPRGGDGSWSDGDGGGEEDAWSLVTSSSLSPSRSRAASSVDEPLGSDPVAGVREPDWVYVAGPEGRGRAGGGCTQGTQTAQTRTDAESGGEPRRCGICLDEDLRAADGHRICGCGHWICAPCLRHYLRTFLPQPPRAAAAADASGPGLPPMTCPVDPSCTCALDPLLIRIKADCAAGHFLGCPGPSPSDQQIAEVAVSLDEHADRACASRMPGEGTRRDGHPLEERAGHPLEERAGQSGRGPQCSGDDQATGSCAGSGAPVECASCGCWLFGDTGPPSGGDRCKGWEVRCRCGGSTCGGCGGLWHGHASCAEAEEQPNGCSSTRQGDAEFCIWDVRCCPGCGTGIEKNGGCEHMICATCRREFCWKCGGPFPHRTNAGCSPSVCARYQKSCVQLLQRALGMCEAEADSCIRLARAIRRSIDKWTNLQACAVAEHTWALLRIQATRPFPRFSQEPSRRSVEFSQVEDASFEMHISREKSDGSPPRSGVDSKSWIACLEELALRAATILRAACSVALHHTRRTKRPDAFVLQAMGASAEHLTCLLAVMHATAEGHPAGNAALLASARTWRALPGERLHASPPVVRDMRQLEGLVGFLDVRLTELAEQARGLRPLSEESHAK